MLGERGDNELVKIPVVPLSLVPVVGLAAVPKATPRAEMEAPPSEVTSPRYEAWLLVMEVADVVVTVGAVVKGKT